jgi:hypothetical protein
LVTAWLGQVPAAIAAAFVSEKTSGHNFTEWYEAPKKKETATQSVAVLLF